MAEVSNVELPTLHGGPCHSSLDIMEGAVGGRQLPLQGLNERAMGIVLAEQLLALFCPQLQLRPKLMALPLQRKDIDLARIDGRRYCNDST